MSRYQELVAFARKVKPYVYSLQVYQEEDGRNSPSFLVRMTLTEYVYDSIKVFEPWQPTVMFKNKGMEKKKTESYLTLSWKIPIQEVLDEYPIDGLGHRPRDAWMLERVREVAG